MWLRTMKAIWWVSELYVLLKPLEAIGDWMEDYGLDHKIIVWDDIPYGRKHYDYIE